MTIISKNDIKGSLPFKVVNSFADNGTKDWLKLLLKRC